MNKKQQILILSWRFSASSIVGAAFFVPYLSWALPPATDTPEEVLRTEIITEARSPVDGKPLTPAQYAELQAQLEAGPPIDPKLSPQVKRTITLLRLRKFIRTFFPFLLR
jgi:hypothetical protein